TLGPILEANDVAFVAHDATDVKALAAGEFGETAGVGGVASAAGEPDVDIDQDFSDASGRCGLDGGGGVDGKSDAGAGGGHFSEPGGVADLLGQKEVVPEAGGRQSRG